MSEAAAERILVVDDHPENRELLLRRLSKAGYAVRAAAGGLEALDMLDGASIDLILLDVMMPDLSGMDVLHWVRKRFTATQLAVIMVTARDQPADIVAALEAGASDYVTKPIQFPVVLARIRVQLALIAAQREADRQKRELMLKTDQLQAVTNSLSIFLDTGSWREASTWLLRSALRQTGSASGFFAVIGEEGRACVLAYEGFRWERFAKALEAELRIGEAPLEDGCFDLVESDGPIARVIQGETVVSSPLSPEDRPGGALWDGIPLTHLLGVPVRSEQGVIGIVVVANREDGYTAADRRALELLAHPAGVFCRGYRSHRQNRSLEEQLQQSQKMESIGQLAGGIAHDFNNMLTVIKGYCGILAERLSDDARLSEIVGEVQQAAEQSASLTSQLLAFGRKQLLERRPLELTELIRKLEKLLSRTLGEHVRLRTVLPEQPLVLRADKVRLEQVLINLAVNARDAMMTGGDLTIQLEGIEQTAAQLKDRPMLRPGRYARISVKDTGTGMDAATRARCFEPFYTTKPMGAGTGLGLSVVEGIVAQSGGYITVESALGRGTTFHVYLPGLDEAHADEMVIGSAPIARRTILVVEDEAAVRRFIVATLSARGYDVLAAGSAEEAEALCRDRDDPIDLLVTDVVMPGRSGRELHDRLRETMPALRTLMITGYSEEVADEAADAPALLTKPFTAVTLLERVRRLLAGEDR